MADKYKEIKPKAFNEPDHAVFFDLKEFFILSMYFQIDFVKPITISRL